MEPAKSRLDPDQISLEATVMALREELMSYFKGSCVSRVTAKRNVQRVSLGDFRPRVYRYQRELLAKQEPCILLLGGAPLCSLQHAPEVITFHARVFNRSPQLRQVRRELEKFLNSYLGGVKKEENHANVIFE